MSQNTEPPTVKPRRAWIPALGLLLLAVVVAIVSWARQEPLPTPWALPPLPPEPLSAKYKETCLAFNSDSAPPSPRQLVELVQFFGDLDARLKTATPTAAPAGSQTPSANSVATSTGPIDTERLFQEAHRHGLIPASPYSDDPKFRAAMIGEIAPTGADWLEAMADVAHFRSVLITRVLPLEVATPTGTSVVPDGTVEVLVYLRRTDDWGGFGKERWWLRKSSIGWQIYDYENLYTGERLSQYIAILIADALKGSSSSVRILVGLGKSSQFMQEDAASAAKVLASIDPAPLPPAVRALYDYCAGAAALQRKDFAGARAQFDAALALKPDFAAALILRGECLNREGQFADAEAVAGQIEAQVGRDPHAAELRAAALIATGRTDGLADQFRTVLDFKPGDKPALNNLYDCLPAGQKGELVARFETCAKLLWQSQAPAVAELFASLASRLLKARDADTLCALVEAQAVRAPNDDWVLLYRIKAFQLRNQPQAVVDALKDSLPGVKDAKIQALLADSRYQALAQLKRAVEGYNGAAETDKPTAFRVMAEALQDAHDVDGMADLILARAKEAPDDVWVHFFAGIRSLMMNDFPRAEAHLEQAIPLTTDAATKTLFRQYWLFAAYKAEHGLLAFDAADDKKAAFEQLSRYYMGDSRIELLEMLVTRYARIAPDDPELVLASAEIDFFSGHYEAAVAKLTAHREAIQTAGRSQAWDFFDCLLRSEIRLKQFATAELELANVPDEGEKLFFSAVLAAQQGDLAKTRAALLKCLQLEFTLKTIYSDVDLGPVLLSEAFAALRKDFPPPADLPKTSNAEVPGTPGTPATPAEPQPMMGPQKP